jgi:hypothetical protein
MMNVVLEEKVCEKSGSQKQTVNLDNSLVFLGIIYSDI